MFGLGPIEIAVVFGFLLFSAIATLGSRTAKLVLQRLVAHEPASGETTPAIELVGRQQGIISFLLTLVGISPITDFRVTPDELCCNSTSLFGRQNQSVPLRAISSIAAGVRKPVGYLFVAFIFLVLLIKQGKREEAISVLRGIVLGFPNSSEAGLAKVTLEKAGISV